MPAPKPPEFRQRAVELARLREKPITEITKDLGISESCLRRWVSQADVDDGHKEGLTTDEREELVRPPAPGGAPDGASPARTAPGQRS